MTTSVLKCLILSGICLLLIMVAACGKKAGFVSTPDENLKKENTPALTLSGRTTVVSSYRFLGAWSLPPGRLAKFLWTDIVDLKSSQNKATFHITAGTARLSGARQTTLVVGNEEQFYNTITWETNQLSMISFCAVSPARQTAVLEVDTDTSLALYVNSKLVKAVSADSNIELGANLLIPVALEAGENMFVLKITSIHGPPRIRMSLTLDRSKDFQTAWNNSWGFLTKLIYNKAGNSFEAPAVRWDSLLGGMTIGAEVSDVINGTVLIKKESLRSGNIVRDGGKVLGEGLYKIAYSSNEFKQDTATERFLVGSPKKVFDIIKTSLDGLSWEPDEYLNIEAQLRRMEILFDRTNYDAESKTWQEKVLFTLGCLAEYVELKRKNSKSMFKHLTGLHLKGFVSRIDNSKQFYRLFVPSNYSPDKKLPLLLIIPTSVAVRERPFIESPFVASHRQAVRLGQLAEKYNFGILWPGYRNALAGWTYEPVRTEEALAAVENDYSIDRSKISLYGTCSGAFFASRLAATYPNRYAAIVYDRAIFERDPGRHPGAPDSIKEWFNAINPKDKIIENQNLKIIVLNDGSRGEGHGEIELSRQFLDAALPKRPDIKHALGQRKMGVMLWDMIFEFLVDCKNERNNNNKADVLAKHGYAGPISEVFATPFYVVEGTAITGRVEAFHMNRAMQNLMAKYQKQFHGAKFVLKKDSEITDAEIEKYSLVLVGNAKCNSVWGRLAARHPESFLPYNPPNNTGVISTTDAFVEVTRNPANQKNYLLLFGSEKVRNLALLDDFDPFQSWFDCYVHRNHGGFQKNHIIARRPQRLGFP